MEMEHDTSDESSASGLHFSVENMKCILTGSLSSSGESAVAPIINNDGITPSTGSVIEPFEELSKEVVFTSESGKKDSGRPFHLVPDFEQMVKNAERTCVRTPSFRKAADLLREHRNATISGSMKDGKTTLALSLCHEYWREGWNIYFHDFSNKRFGLLSASKTGKSLYVFENIFSSPIIHHELENITKKKEEKTDSVFLFTCLSFNLKGCNIKLYGDLFSDEHIVDLACELKHCNFLKWKILRKHPSRLSTVQVSEIAQQSPTHTGFPGLCKLFSDSSVDDPIRFFTYPHEHYQVLLRSLFQDKRKCCVFMNILLLGGKVYLKNMIEGSDSVTFVKQLLQQTFQGTRMENLRRELPLLYGIFLKESYHIVSFQHDVIYDAAVFVLDNMYPGFLWKHCKVEHVADGDIGWTKSLTGECRTIYLTQSNSNHIINHLVENFKHMQLKSILEHPVLHSNHDNVDLFIDKLERSYENFITYEDPSGGNFLFWCMKSSCVDMQRTVLNHPFLTNEHVFACLAFDLTQQENKLSDRSVDIVLEQIQISTDGYGRLLQDLLFTATSTGDVGRVDYCVKQGASLTLPNKAGETCLHLASLHGHFPVILALTENFELESVDPENAKGMTPAMVAEEQGFSEITLDLLAKGADPSVKNDEGNALIHLSCLSGNVDATRFLLHSKKQDADLLGQDERTPVMMAALAGELKTVMLLEEYGCDMSARDKNGDNILHMSCLGGCLKVVDHVLASCKVNINSTNNKRRSCLMIASLHGNEALFNILLAGGCDPSLSDIKGNTALHYAFSGKDVEYIQRLLTKEIFDINSKGEEGRSPMMMAVTLGLAEILDFVLVQSIHWKSVDTSGNNVLHEACRSQRLGIVKKILSFKVLDIDCRGRNEMTPVMFAALTGNIKMLDMLITLGAKTSLQDGDGNTILHLASRKGQTDMVLHIMRMKLLDINIKGFRSRSPLMMAVHSGHTSTVEILVGESDLSDVDEDGNSPLVLACMSDSDNDVIVDMLVKANKVLSGESHELPSPVATGNDENLMTESLVEQYEHSPMSLESISNTSSISGDALEIRRDQMQTVDGSQDGWTPIMHAAKGNNINILKYLCPLYDIFEYNYSGDNALHVACRSNSVEVAVFLITEYPTLIDMDGNEGKTPLMIAVLQKNKTLFRNLVDRGANPLLTDSANNNVLHIAASVGDVGLVEMLVKENICDINSKGHFGRTAFMIAARRKNDNVCDALDMLGCDPFCLDDYGNSILHVSNSGKILQKMQGRLDIDTPNKFGVTPVMKAARRGQVHIFKCLLNLGSNINIKSNDGFTLLHEASIGGNVEIVKLLIAQDDVDIDVTEKRGKTPVMFAAEKGHKSVFLALVFAGCDLLKRDNNGKTCYRYALKGGNEDIVKYIEKSTTNA